MYEYNFSNSILLKLSDPQFARCLMYYICKLKSIRFVKSRCLRICVTVLSSLIYMEH